MATRRKFLIGAAAATTGLAGAAGSATAQADTTFELELTEQGFVGRAPSSISGTTNPTLEVEAGNRYAIQWTNSYNPETEGLPARHNLVVTTDDGVVRRGEYVFETGQTRTIRFNAQSGLSEYFCEEHMGEGGEFSVSGGATATPTESDMDGGEDTATPTESDMGGDGEGGDGGGDGGGEETSGGGPGFGVSAAVTAIGAAAYGALRKNSDE
jgi:PGF-CTERM protein